MGGLKDIFLATGQGIFDSLKGIKVILYLDYEVNKKIKSKQLQQQLNNVYNNQRLIKSSDNKKLEESKVLKRVFECCMLNGGVFGASILIFNYLLLPLLQNLLSIIFNTNTIIGNQIWDWMRPILLVLFNSIWVLPIFLLSKIVNVLWFQDIADSAYKFRKGKPQLIPSISKLIADTLFSLLVQALFLVQSFIVGLIPIYHIGDIISFIHLTLLYSLYIFEYKWFNMGWELHKRLTFIEYNWPYFIGFSIPLTIITQIPSNFLIRGCVFAILFPLFILSGNEAIPVTGVCELPLRLFSPVVAISNAFFKKTTNQSQIILQQQQQPPDQQQQINRTIPTNYIKLQSKVR